MAHKKRSLATCFMAKTNEPLEHWQEKDGITYSVENMK
jgi:hypothetical protein